MSTQTDAVNKKVNKKGRTALKIISAVLAALIIFFIIINALPPRKNVSENPFLIGEGELPMIAAHRGGGVCNPENTLLAFREAVNTIGVDILESDLYLTADGYLVYNHDSYIDETCNVNGDISLEEVKELCKDKAKRHYIKDMTLEQLRQYNFGYYFEDKSGERIYKDVTDIAERGLQIATADQLFAEFYESRPDLLFIVEIKDGGERGFEACKLLADTLGQYPNYEKQIVIGTFNKEIDEELKSKYPHLYRGASEATAGDFVISHFLGVNLFYENDFACLQIPTEYDVKGIDVPLDLRTIINRAHRRNIAVQYWTINDAEDMRRLTEMGCDAIMTDDPVLLKSVLEEYK